MSTTSFHADETILSYSFSHEYPYDLIDANHSRIQQAFFSLIPPAELIEIHYKLCQALTTLYFERAPERSGDNDQDDINIFVIPIP